MSLGWHVISGEDLIATLRRASAGESADLVFAELWANASHKKPASASVILSPSDIEQIARMRDAADVGCRSDNEWFRRHSAGKWSAFCDVLALLDGRLDGERT
jgi:hypothetical protein